MKRTMRFNTEEEMNNYFPDGVPNNVLGIVDNPNGNNVLYTSSNNQIVSGEEEGGFITSPEDLARIAALEEGKADKSELVGLASETWVENQNYLTQHQDLSNYALKSDIPSAQSLEGYATESYVVSKIESVVGAAPAALDTLKEIGDSLNNDADFAGTMTTALAGKANAADVYTKTEIQNMGYLTSHQSLADYATKAEISAAGYLTSHQDLSDYALKSELPVVPSLNGYATESYVADYVSTYAPTPDLSAYVSKADLSNCGYVTGGEISQMGYITANNVPAPDLSDYVTYSYALDKFIHWGGNIGSPGPNKFVSSIGVAIENGITTIYPWFESVPEPDLSAYVSKTELSAQSYLTAHQSLNGYATESYVMAKVGAIETVVNAILNGASNPIE